jgi:hypothetical protein
MKTTPTPRKPFTKTLIALAAIATLSAPALVNAQPQSQHDQMQHTSQPQNPQAQHYDQRGPQDRQGPQVDGRDIDRRIADLRGRIDMGRQTHQLNRNEARRLTSRLNSIASLKRSYERHGLTNREVMTLNSKLDALNGQLRFDRH